MKTFRLIMQHFPTVLAGVMAVEEAMPEAPGATKKAAVLAGVSAAAAVAQLDPSSHVAAAGVLTDSIVSAFNSTGWFSRNPQKAAAAK